jgi:hypothetical protein
MISCSDSGCNDVIRTFDHSTADQNMISLGDGVVAGSYECFIDTSDTV